MKFVLICINQFMWLIRCSFYFLKLEKITSQKLLAEFLIYYTLVISYFIYDLKIFHTNILFMSLWAIERANLKFSHINRMHGYL